MLFTRFETRFKEILNFRFKQNLLLDKKFLSGKSNNIFWGWRKFCSIRYAHLIFLLIFFWIQMVVRYSTMGDFHAWWFTLPRIANRELARFFGVRSTNGLPRTMSQRYLRDHVGLLGQEPLRATPLLAGDRTPQ